MSHSLGGYYKEEDMINEASPFYPLTLPPSTRTENTTPPADEHAVKRINGLREFLTPPTPHSSDRSLKDRVTLGAPNPSLTAEEKEKLEQELDAIFEPPLDSLRQAEALENRTSIDIANFPNAAIVAVNRLCGDHGVERSYNEKIKAKLAEVNKCQETIEKLQTLNRLITKHKDGDKISEEMQQLRDELKAEGIHLWNDATLNLSKEQASEYKILLKDEQETIKSRSNIIMTTQIRYLIDLLTSLLECVKEMVRNHTGSLKSINNRMLTR